MDEYVYQPFAGRKQGVAMLACEVEHNEGMLLAVRHNYSQVLTPRKQCIYPFMRLCFSLTVEQLSEQCPVESMEQVKWKHFF